MESCKAIVGNLLSQDVAIVGNLQLGIDAIAHLLSVRSGKPLPFYRRAFYMSIRKKTLSFINGLLEIIW